jgi:hypothetical protein
MLRVSTPHLICHSLYFVMKRNGILTQIGTGDYKTVIGKTRDPSTDSDDRNHLPRAKTEWAVHAAGIAIAFFRRSN